MPQTTSHSLFDSNLIQTYIAYSQKTYQALIPSPTSLNLNPYPKIPTSTTFGECLVPKNWNHRRIN